MFAVFFKGDKKDGCDYTIGCNQRYEELMASNWEEAIKEAKEMIEDGLGGYGGIKTIDIIEVASKKHYTYKAFLEE